ncbi:UNVERIFIED_CONTAM: hypothetical protein K2H54_044880 [Gekko kuhli]
MFQQIHTEDVGDLYKVRIGHNNSGESPAWHCKELLLQNLMTEEQFGLPVHRWLAQDQDDGEICRELPVPQQGQPLLPVAMYEVQVVTGDLWNAGTEADIYISVYGEKGDTGSRQLHKSKKPRKFLKGQVDIFSLEALHLGKLHKIIIGHNGLGSGNGWFLEKIVVKDPITNSDYTFLCHSIAYKKAEAAGLVAVTTTLVPSLPLPMFSITAVESEMMGTGSYGSYSCSIYSTAVGSPKHSILLRKVARAGEVAPLAFLPNHGSSQGRLAL